MKKMPDKRIKAITDKLVENLNSCLLVYFRDMFPEVEADIVGAMAKLAKDELVDCLDEFIDEISPDDKDVRNLH